AWRWPQPTASGRQPPAGSHESVVQAFWSSQSSAPATKQPVAESQASVVQASPSFHTTGAWRQLRSAQASVVQALPSSQERGVALQPSCGSQLSVVQGFWSSQVI